MKQFMKQIVKGLKRNEVAIPEENDETELNSLEDDSDEKCYETVELINKYPEIQGFGLDISGGKDRPYIANDPGIFVIGIKENGLAEKSRKIEVDDKILMVNGHDVVCVTHDEAVKHFVSDRKKVTLVLQKYAGQLIRAASGTPTPTSGSLSPGSERSGSPRRDRRSITEVDNTISLSGFLLGLTLGCVTVVLIKRLLINK